MGPGRFRALSDRMDAVLVDRLGDRATLPGGELIGGTFVSPFLGSAIGGASRSARLGQVINADSVKEPTFTARVVDVEAIVKGAVLDIDLPSAQGGGRYRVVRLEPDGTGMIDLILGAYLERADDIT